MTDGHFILSTAVRLKHEPFKLREHKTDVRTEITAGLTTFMAILYIVPVNAFIMIISMTPLRRWMIETIPMDIKRAVSAGFGWRCFAGVFCAVEAR